MKRGVVGALDGLDDDTHRAREFEHDDGLGRAGVARALIRVVVGAGADGRQPQPSAFVAQSGQLVLETALAAVDADAVEADSSREAIAVVATSVEDAFTAFAALARIAVGVVSAEVRIADALAVDAALARLALVIVAAQSARPALPVDAIEAW